jgi:hypothetical protein
MIFVNLCFFLYALRVFFHVLCVFISRGIATDHAEKPQIFFVLARIKTAIPWSFSLYRLFDFRRIQLQGPLKWN